MPELAAGAELARQWVSMLDSLAGLRQLLALGQAHQEPRVFLGQAVQLMLRSHDINQCSVFLADQGTLSCAAGAGLGDRLLRPRPTAFRLGQGLMGQAALDRSTVWVHDAPRDHRFLPHPNGLLAPPRALVCVPLIAEQALLGVLNVSHPDAAALAHWHAKVFSMYGQLLAHLLHHHRLMTRLPLVG
jgi:GAF domain-containing protein